MVHWKQVCDEAPDLATSVRDRFASNLHHVIGTVRTDGTTTPASP